MTILAFDLSGNACSVAIGRYQGSTIECLGVDHHPMEMGQANALFPQIQSLMNRVRVTARDLDTIVVTRGPGSFTGIRAGLAAAKGLALAQSLPLLGVSTFDVYASRVALESFPLLVVLESKRVDLYVQLYTAPNHPLWGPGKTLELPALLAEMRTYQKLTVIGDGQAHLATTEAGQLCPEIQSISPQDVLAYLSGKELTTAAFPYDPLNLRPALMVSRCP